LEPLRLAVDAYTDLPPELIANVVTYLEMRASVAQGARPEAGLAFVRLRGGQAGRYLALYRALGERWMWFSRLALAPQALAAILDDPGVEAYAAVRDGADVGLVELDARAEDETELAFLGLVEGAVGAGLGRALMAQAVGRAFARPIRRLFVHTCTFDHPRAVGFYRACGFEPYKFAIELTRDPRLEGLLPPQAAPHVPLLHTRKVRDGT
jgi:GNAT superfamily N-acetyltransferase